MSRVWVHHKAKWLENVRRIYDTLNHHTYMPSVGSECLGCRVEEMAYRILIAMGENVEDE